MTDPRSEREDFPGGGETGELIRTFDWSTTPLGPRARWSTALKTLVRVVLNTRQPMILWWGEALTQLHNDAMLESMRDRHAVGMGEPGRQAWRESWRVLGHELQRVVSHGDMIWNEDILVPVARNGTIEDAYWTYSYSPVFDDDGSRAGMLIIGTETTAGVVARQQLERANREAELAREELRSAFLQAPIPIAIIAGADHVVMLANPAYETLVGRPVVGRRLSEVFSEEEVGYYVPLITGVQQTGEPVLVTGAELNLRGPDGVVEHRFIDVGYHPYRNTDLATIGVIVLVSDVTAAVLARRESERQDGERSVVLQQEQELRRAAEAGESARDEFLAMLGHELRNPLAPIVTAVDLMRMTGDRQPKERAIIERQVKHLSALVDDLLDVAQVTRGKLELCKLPVEIGDVIGQAIEMATPLVVRGEHALRRHGASEPLLVDGDRMRLAQVVSNLLANAARYTPPHGAIDVSCARDGDTVVITVADNGPGIPAGLLPRIFELFVQGEQRFDRAKGGLGLGLALVKNLVVMHGGTVAVRNRETGGSEFTVRLPMLAASAIPVAQDDSPTARTIGSTPRRRILVVDDNEDAAELLAELLGAMGHEVVVANDGPQALAALATFVPEVGFLDLGLPGMDGFELARQLRARVTAAPLRLVAVTGYGQDRDREASAAAGFDAHLTKPVSLSDIARLVAVAPP